MLRADGRNLTQQHPVRGPAAGLGHRGFFCFAIAI